MSDFETARDDLPSNMPVMIVALLGGMMQVELQLGQYVI